jgi:ATPase subunit of ABC transporter with duplicated ATPase domains
MHKPITIQNLSIQFKQKLCFDDFSQHVHFGDRIAIIGANGSGKSSLLKAIQGSFSDYEGVIILPNDTELSYVPQLLHSDKALSGGELFNKTFFDALATVPNCLLVDEPTNHLDQTNRIQLMDQIRYFYGTVIAVTHDVDFMNQCFDKVWHINNGIIKVFSGKYDDYHQQRIQEKNRLDKQLKTLSKDKKSMHTKLMQEQQRAAKSSAKGAKSINNKKWATVVGHAKARRAQETTGKKKAALSEQRQDVFDQLESMNIPQVIKPSVHMPSQQGYGVLVQVNDGAIAYGEKTIISNIFLTINNQDKVVIKGDNGSGKTSLIKAFMGESSVNCLGQWMCLDKHDIGYLDQHYHVLPQELSVLSALQQVVPHWEQTQYYRHLADFLFKGDDAVHLDIEKLSGGERARLALALIAAKPPKLLILDEITNNVDLETIDHLVEILSEYPGAVLIISHNQNFLDQLPMNKVIVLKGGKYFEV